MPNSKHRTRRFELRLPRKAKVMLKPAADTEHKSLSAFLLDKALEAAAETLAERCQLSLSAKQYDAFVAALDSASKPRLRLERLMTNSSVLD